MGKKDIIYRDENPDPIETDQKILRIGKDLQVMSHIIKIILLIAAILIMIGACLITINSDFYLKVGKIFMDNSFYKILDAITDLSGIEPRFLSAIAWTISAISAVMMSFYAGQLEKFTKLIINEKNHFTTKAASTLRISAIMLAPLLLVNLFFALAMIGITVLFSYLFDYGAYLQEKADEKNRIEEEMIVSFAEITENKSGQTGQHVKRVSEYSKVIAKAMGLTDGEVENIRLASTMHDIGKLMIPSEILDKPGKLDADEFAVIKQHTTYGGELLDNVEGDIMHLSRDIALEHHERIDGKGYPYGKTDEDISLAAKIVAVADVYDALTSKRSYKDAWDEQKAREEIVKNKGTQFDSKVVDAFDASYDEILKVKDIYKDSCDFHK
ncbi:MAG: HD-GYP domain-containing protein [Lachnospiraceae bacterium]|nr:HD-GYP domain-containing protein [Lachnospiraceae bacterium]